MDQTGRVPPTDDRTLPPEVGALLDAVTALSSDLDLGSVLSRIVEAATQLTGAQYGALGVIGPKNTLVEFVTTGMADSTRRSIGDLPHGRGILGLLIAQPETIRLEDLSAHPASVGFPENHPPMSSFLGVPVRIRGTVFGNLYLTEKRGGASFSDADARLVETLARTAGYVVENARAYGLSERRRRWLETSADLYAMLQPPLDPATAIAYVARAARTMSGARAAAVVGAESARTVAVEPQDADRIDAALDQIASGASRATEPWHRVDGLHALAIPLNSHLDESRLLVAFFDSPPDSIEDHELLVSLADQAAVAMDRAQAVADRQQLAVVTDRERIARDLHDVVIQRLFATGLQLQGVSLLAGDPQVTERLEDSMDELDTTIREIRQTIFELQSHDSGSVRTELQSLVREYTTVFGFAPRMRTSGPVDTVVTGDVRSHVLAVAREALSNAARHASPTSVDLEMHADAGEVILTVCDDGIGLPEKRSESGLRNARRRATDLGGSLELTAHSPRGTRLVWRASLGG